MEKHPFGAQPEPIKKPEPAKYDGSVPLPVSAWLGSQEAHGSAGWLNEGEFSAAGLVQGTGVLIGQSSSGDVLGYGGDGHTMIFAPPGSGKGVGFVLPNLVEYPGSMLILDPKGENAACSARQRKRMGQVVHVLDPFGLTGLPSSRFNPLSVLALSDRTNIMADIASIASALITEDGKEPHWPDGAKRLVECFILFLLAHEPKENRHLMRVFELITSSEETYLRLFSALANSEHPDLDLRRNLHAAGNWYSQVNEKELGSFKSVAFRSLNWLKDFIWKENLSASDFDVMKLKLEPTTIYLVLPFERMATHKAWLRVMLTMGIIATLRLHGQPKHPVVFMLDEYFAGIGNLDVMMNAAPTIRGSGGRFALVFQSLAQLQSLYPKVWNDFCASAGVAAFFNVNDMQTAEYVSKRLGNKTINTPGQGMNTMGRALLTPDEVMRNGKNRAIVFLQGSKPFQCQTLDSRTDARFASKLDPNPHHGKTVQPRHVAASDDEFYVPVHLTGDTNSTDAFQVTGIDADLIAQLEKQFGCKIIQVGKQIGYINDSGRFEVLTELD